MEDMKLTPLQKRGLPAGKIAGSLDFQHDRGTLHRTPRTWQEIRAAQLELARLAQETTEPSAWLTDVLEALGLRYNPTSGRVVERAAAECGDFAGTKRGYDIHLRGYTKACDACRGYADEQLHNRFGIKGDERWTFQSS